MRDTCEEMGYQHRWGAFRDAMAGRDTTVQVRRCKDCGAREHFPVMASTVAMMPKVLVVMEDDYEPRIRFICLIPSDEQPRWDYLLGPEREAERKAIVDELRTYLQERDGGLQHWRKHPGDDKEDEFNERLKKFDRETEKLKEGAVARAKTYPRINYLQVEHGTIWDDEEKTA